MKKILIAAFALFIGTSVFAQENPLTFGVQAGLNMSQLASDKMDGEKGDASDMLAGFYIGGHANYSLGEYFGIQGELKFSMQGGKETQVGQTVKLKLDYINVPVLFEVKPATNFSIFVGPQIGFNVSKTASVGGISISGSEFEDQIAKINTIDFAAVVGVQYAIGGKYLLSARYNIGFTTVPDIKGLSGSENRVIQIGVGYKF